MPLNLCTLKSGPVLGSCSPAVDGNMLHLTSQQATFLEHISQLVCLLLVGFATMLHVLHSFITFVSVLFNIAPVPHGQ